MEENYVEIDSIISKLAIEKGFNSDEIYFRSKPTMALFQHWLRENHNIDVLPYLVDDQEYSYCCMVFKDKEELDYCHSYKTYELALEAGLISGLKSVPDNKNSLAKIEDFNVIDNQNTIKEYLIYRQHSEYNPYPVMYVEGEPI